jgi:Fe2+ or Zn2+ uptake regulation protein
VDAPGAAGLANPSPTPRPIDDRRAIDERATAALRAAGRRVTRPRLAVYRSLTALGGHRSAEDVVAALRAAGERLPRASVYNALEALRGAGVVMQARADAGAALYEAAATWHHHFVCRRCGSITDVPCATGTKPCLHPDLPGVEVDEAEVIYHGLCPQCRAQDTPIA